MTEDGHYRALGDLSRVLAEVADLDELGTAYHELIGRVIDFPMRAIYLFGPSSVLPAWTTSDGVSERFMTTYERVGRSVDTELREVLRSASPVYNLAFRTLGQWRRTEVYLRASSIERMAHVIKAPVVAQQRVIGTVDFASPAENREVSRLDVELAAGVAGIVGGAVRALSRRQRVEKELTVANTALDTGDVAFVWFDDSTTEPHLTTAAAEMVGGLQEGRDIIYRIIRDIDPASDRTSRSYLVRHRDGSKDVLTCTLRPVLGYPGAELISLTLEAARSENVSQILEGLSARQMEVASLVASGFSDQEIADELLLSLYTVRQHIKNIYLKLGISGRVQLTRLVLGRTPRAGAVPGPGQATP